MKIKMFTSFAFILLFLCFLCAQFKVEAATAVVGGVNIQNDFGIKSFNSNTGYLETNSSGFEVYRVTDSNWSNSSQPTIRVDLNQYGIADAALYNGAYKTIVVIFQITMAEIDDGYQEIYITDPNSTYVNHMVTAITAFEHGEGYKKDEYQRYEFYAELSYASFTSSMFEICFSAHGNGSDSWKFYNCRVQICTSNETRKYTNLLFVENAIVDEI